MLHRIIKKPENTYIQQNYQHSYIHRPPKLETISLIEYTRNYSYVAHQKGSKWKEQEKEAIVNVYPKFYKI